MQIHQVLVSASTGDAITNQAFELRSLLRQVGGSEIYALHGDPRLGDEVKPLADLGKRHSSRPGSDILIFRSSIGEPEVTNFVLRRPERLVVIYHNISPWEPFLHYAPAFAGLLAAGRLELASLAERTELALADSAYNAGELIEAGFRNVVVSPLIVDLRRLQEIEPHGPTMHHLDTLEDDPILLFVGQLLPHKRPDLLLAAYDVLVTHLMPRTRLIMVGTPRLPRFFAFLEHYAKELNLNRAWMTGSVGDSELVAFYRRATAFVTLSEHEGFCVPLLEAMGFDLPIVARNFAAVPETLSGAGLMLEPEDGAEVIAEAMATVLQEGSVRDQLIARGRTRLEDHNPENARRVMLGHLLDVI